MAVLGSIQVEIDSVRAGTLFNAVVERIDQVAESSGETCSCDVEGLTQYDKTLGRTQVRMRYWGKEPRTVNLELAQGRKLTVVFTRGEDVICGRDHALTSREMLQLRLRASSDRLADKRFLREWLLSAWSGSRSPPKT